MKISEGYELKEIAGSYVVLPTGAAAVDFNGIITLNETGVFLWKKLIDGADKQSLCDAICAEYEIDEQTAMTDIEAFLQKLTDNNCLDID